MVVESPQSYKDKVFKPWHPRLRRGRAGVTQSAYRQAMPPRNTRVWIIKKSEIFKTSDFFYGIL